MGEAAAWRNRARRRFWMRDAGRKRRIDSDEGDAGTVGFGGQTRAVGAVGGDSHRPAGPDDTGRVATDTVMFSIVAAERPAVRARLAGFSELK